MYGYDLSSRSRALSGGRWRLISCCSSSSASLALATTIGSIEAARETSSSLLRSRLTLAKYDATRLRSEAALPTYSTVPSEVRQT